MPDVEPDWKPEKGKASTRRGTNRARRIVDRNASKTALLTERSCVACGRPGANSHHVLPKDKGGDDVAANLVTLCGSGTMGCHGAHHGNPYVVEKLGRKRVSERRDAEWVNRRIGTYLFAERPEAIRYVCEKLGVVAGHDWLFRIYFVPKEPLG